MYTLALALLLFSRFCDAFTIVRRSIDGDLLNLPSFEVCTKYAFTATWNQQKKECTCDLGETFYALNDHTFGCYEGYGQNVGCNLQFKGSPSVKGFPDNNDKIASLGTFIVPPCRYSSVNVSRWSFKGWTPDDRVVVKYGRKVKVSWLNAPIEEVRGKLFKVDFACETTGSNCFLMKMFGTSDFYLPTTKAPTIFTTQPPKSQGPSVVVVVVICTIVFLLLVAISLLLFFCRHRIREKFRSIAKKKEEDIYSSVDHTRSSAYTNAGFPRRNEINSIYTSSDMDEAPSVYTNPDDDTPLKVRTALPRPKVAGVNNMTRPHTLPPPSCGDEEDVYLQPVDGTLPFDRSKEGPLNERYSSLSGIVDEDMSYSTLSSSEPAGNQNVYFTLDESNKTHDVYSTLDEQPTYFETERDDIDLYEQAYDISS